MIAAGAITAGTLAVIALCWRHARREDQVWGNRWGWPEWPEPSDGIEGP